MPIKFEGSKGCSSGSSTEAEDASGIVTLVVLSKLSFTLIQECQFLGIINAYD